MKYRLTEKIGSGGMAEVFRAVGEGPAAFGRPFVVKRIHPRLSGQAEFVRMFVDEANISARLIHPNIVQVFEFAYQDGGYYLVMEPVEGIDMAWLLRRRMDRPSEQLSPAFVAEVGRQVCRGLDFAHTLTDTDGKPLDIVHRDVTPPNIMVSWNGVVKILDFGLARAAEALRLHQSDAGMVRGKMSYLAPELLEGARADARSDLFSLGVVLHELLAGQRLFAGETDYDTLKLVKGMPILRPSKRNPAVKPALDKVVMRALERDPEKRYKSAAEMGDELEDLVLRKGYSTRALARKARELADQEPPADKVRPTPLVVEVPVVGSETSSVIVDESAQQLPAGAGRAPTASRPRRGPGGRWQLPTVALACLFVGAVVGAALRPTAPSAVVVAAPAPVPTPPPAPPAAPTAPAPAATVRVALDSAPQGATVVGAAGPLGKTPLLLNLPRSQDVVELTLTKPGYAPLPYKVIPYQDKELVANLKRTRGRASSAALSAGPAPVKVAAGAGAAVPARYAAPAPAAGGPAKMPAGPAAAAKTAAAAPLKGPHVASPPAKSDGWLRR
jgi:serine/threonine-protein kinase